MRTLKNFIKRSIAALTPGETAWRAASAAIIATWTCVLALISVYLVWIDFTPWKALGFLVASTGLLLVGAGVYLLIGILAAPPSRFARVLIIPLPLALYLLVEFGWQAGAVLVVVVLISLALVSGSLATFYMSGFKASQQKVTMAGLVVGIVLLAGLSYLIGFHHEELNPTLVEYKLPDQTLDMNSPARHGDLPVLFTTYGSGNDLHRIEFGEGAGFMSRSVDGSKLIDNWKGGGGWARSSYWGFGTDELPVQGRIWYPQGDGRYPLVLIVHGNHQMEDYSDPGYEYLGRLLASRGYIFVSVDENFLNLSMADLINPLKPYLEEENDARGWLLLEHLVQWREWNQTVGHVFYDKVDMEEISLIGHSRGGEAVAIAGYFNDLAYYPDDASVPFDYRFNLKGVIAIAPVDGQYKPRDNGTRLRNTSYFVIHGSLDSDVTSFMGLTQFSRTDLHHSNEFKASLYVHGANHGQFNSSWGNQDTALGWSLRKAAIMPAEWQRQIVEVYFSAFLDVVHKGRKEYLPIFKNSRFAAGWLPDTYYINNFKDADSLWLLTFEEDGDPATATLGSASVRTNNLSRWYESWIGLKWRPLETHVAGLAWDDRFSEDTASLEIHFSEPIDLTDFDSLIFSVSQGTGSTLPKDHETGESDKEAKSDEQEEDMKSSLLDWSIVVIDNKGISSKTLLSQVEPLHPQVNEDAFRLQFGNPSPKSEAILKYYSFPIENFSNETGSFNSGSVIEIRFQFDQTARGHIILDDVGLSRKAPGV